MTGHTGFKGSWLCLLLERLGATVSGFSDGLVSQPSLFEEAQIAKSVRDFQGDIRDKELLQLCIEQERPEIVFHLAAQSLVRPSYINPAETFATNVMGTVNLLEAVRKTDSVKAVVVITSDKCYENREQIWGYRENDPMGGFDPYSCSKGCAELVTSCYQKSFFSEGACLVASGRAGNVIGGGDWARDRLIPDFIRATLENRALQIRFPKAVRPWQHVMEPLWGYLLLAERLYQGDEQVAGGWNFGPDEKHTWTVQQVVEKMCQLWGVGAAWEYEQEQCLHEASFLHLDSTKAKRMLHWKPMLSMEETVKMTIEWYRKWYDKEENARVLAMAQIDNYLEKLAGAEAYE